VETRRAEGSESRYVGVTGTRAAGFMGPKLERWPVEAEEEKER